MKIEIEDFNFGNATIDTYKAFNKCRNLIRAERLPDDPPIPLEETIQGFKNFPSFLEMSFWVGWNRPAKEIVAYGVVQLSLKDNLHIADFWINVLPEYRRKGLGRDFLSRIVEIAKGGNRRLLMTDTIDRVPAGEAFMDHIGAEKGLEMHTNQLVIADLDRGLVNQWQAQAKERGAGFEVGLWEGGYPEEYIDDIVVLYDLLNQAPFGSLELEDFTFSAEHIREFEKSLTARGYELWTIFVREEGSGKFAGYTEVFWNPNRPEIIGQGMTGVFPEYRNKGLGRWIKAEMLERILTKRPKAKFIRTENADMNAPMLKINRELGFKPYSALTVWQVETDKVSDYLPR